MSTKPLESPRELSNRQLIKEYDGIELVDAAARRRNTELRREIIWRLDASYKYAQPTGGRRDG